jgi:DHA2 family multidrug resistance protein-like MFS transporter
MAALTADDAALADGLPSPRRYWSVAAICLALTMAVLDGAIANVALPTIARDLGASAASSIWIVNAYQLAVTVALLPLAALGDRLGYRRVWMVGLAVFTVGSIACALSHTLVTLAAARVLQGLGAAAVMSINPALLRFTYPHRLLGRGLGFNAVVISLASALGPTIASAILATATWQWLFAVNGPIGIVALVVGARALPKTPTTNRRFDTISALLNAAAFGFLILGAESVVREGLVPGLIRLAIGAAAGVALVRREMNRDAPLVPLDLMRIPLFGLSVATSIVSFAAQMLAFVALPFFFQGPLGRTAVQTGLLMTPWPLGVALLAPIAGRLADRYPAGLLGGIGLGVFAVGLFSLTMLHPGSTTPEIIWRLMLCGAGFGFFQSPNNRAMVASAPRNRSGAAGGMLATARLLGQTTGALTMAVFFHLFAAGATHVAFGVAAGVAALAALVSLLRMGIDAAPMEITLDAASD